VTPRTFAFEFEEVPVIIKAFRRMVRGLEFDICEMAITTYILARSFDKQIVRDWLTSPASGWDRASGEPPPPLPDEVVERTRSRYIEAYERLTGRTF
jgi:hypothetical protein